MVPGNEAASQDKVRHLTAANHEALAFGNPATRKSRIVHVAVLDKEKCKLSILFDADAQHASALKRLWFVIKKERATGCLDVPAVAISDNLEVGPVLLVFADVVEAFLPFGKLEGVVAVDRDERDEHWSSLSVKAPLGLGFLRAEMPIQRNR